MKKMLKTIFYPNRVVGLFFFLFGFGLLIYVFACHLEDTPLAYFSYILSTYALILFIIWFCKACKFSNEWIKKTSWYQIYQKNESRIQRASLFFSSFLNIVYSLFNFVVGIYYRSFWFLTFAVYYFLLSFMRVSLLTHVEDLYKNSFKEYEKLKRCGIVLLLLNIVLIGMVVLILRTNQNIHYAGSVIYIVALYDFYLIILAFVNAFRYRKTNHPLLLASKGINLTVAMISMLSLEVAMIERFGEQDQSFKVMMTGSLGFTICLINSIMAFYMIIKASRYLKREGMKSSKLS